MKNADIDDMGMSEEINRALQGNPQADVGEIIRQKAARDTAKELADKGKTAQETYASEPELSMAYVLSRIDQILNDTAHIHEAIKAIPAIPVVQMTDGNSCYQGDVAGSSKAEAISQTVLARETTNQQLIRLLEKMYDDVKPKEHKEPVITSEDIAVCAGNLPPDNLERLLKEIIGVPNAGG